MSVSLTQTKEVDGIPREFRKEISQRLQLKSQLSEIRTALKNSPIHCEITEQLKIWEENFSQALSLKVVDKELVGEFIHLLQDILRDPLSQAPLDEDALLGSDLRTYDWKTLAVWLHTAEVNYRGRSPLDPENPTPFRILGTHPGVKQAVQFLKSYEAFLPNEEQENTFREMVNTGVIPRFSRDPIGYLIKLADQHADKLGQKERIQEQFGAKIQPATKPTRERKIHTLDTLKKDQEQLKLVREAEKTAQIQRILERHAHIQAERENQERQFEERLTRITREQNQHAQGEFNAQVVTIQQMTDGMAQRLANLNQRDQERWHALNAAADVNEQDLADMQQRIDALEREQALQNGHLSELERERQRLELSIAKTKQALVANQEKKKKKRFKAIATHVLMGVAAVGAAFILQGLATAATFKGGVMLNTTLFTF